MKASYVFYMVLGMFCLSHPFDGQAQFGRSPKYRQSQSQKLKGKIVEWRTNQGIPNALIELRKDSFVANISTNSLGEFSINSINPGKYSIKVNALHFKTVELKKVKIKKSKGLDLSICMQADTVGIPQKNVTENEFQKPGLIAKKYNNLTQTSAPGYGKHAKRAALKTRNRQVSRFTVRSSSPSFNGGPAPKYRNGSYLVPSTEEYKHQQDNSYKVAKRDPLSTFSIDVDRSSYSNVRRMLKDGMIPDPDAIRVEEMINYFEYKYPQPQNNDPFSLNTEFTVCPWNGNRQLVSIGLQGKTISPGKMSANNLVFLIDVSGSMDEENKLPLVKSSLRLLVKEMRLEDKISIVVYAGAAGLVLPSTSGEFKSKILEALENLQAGGSTAGGAGIQLAYETALSNFIKDGNNRVILATDGDFNVGLTSERELENLITEKRKSNISLSVLGFGTGNLKDSRMEALADKGNGNYSYIDNLLEGHKVLVKEMGGTLVTIAKDVKIQVEFNPSRVKSYRLVGYENRILEAKDFNDDKKDAGDMGSGHSVTALYEIIPTESNDRTDSIDPLKYQVSNFVTQYHPEILTVKVRYKKPGTDSSLLVKSILEGQPKPFDRASENVRFSCAVAEFGMVLRDSEYKGKADFSQILDLARSSKGTDEEGYRSEFIRLADLAKSLKK